MIGCIYYDTQIFQSFLEGLSLGKGKPGGEIRDVLDLLFSRTEQGH
jgi:hypothetical protein